MNTRNTFVSKLAGLMSAVALAVVLSGGLAYAQDAAAPADAAAAPAMTDPAAAPADVAAAPADAAPAEGATTTSDQVEVENPYGFAAMWEHGDFVAKTVLFILIFMSMGTWYITILRLFDTASVLRQADAAQKNFWTAGSLKEGVAKLDANSVFRTVVEDGLRASEHHEGKLTDQVDLNEWVTMSLQRSQDAINGRLGAGLSFLASVGSVAPFVGLFGTVWGILNALISIGVAGQVSIDRVAGPLGEALIMTAIGLAVAVPAVLFYNLLVARNKIVAARVRNFSADVHAVLLSGRAQTRRA
ncbi:MAG: MotA/TolQ/ExbB proton channel family protein [Rhodospirillaceae bacterium]|nr:MotA/TolQ/ExbB proton channel family protein [Rhodospirillaceae bacterium]